MLTSSKEKVTKSSGEKLEVAEQRTTGHDIHEQPPESLDITCAPQQEQGGHEAGRSSQGQVVAGAGIRLLTAPRGSGDLHTWAAHLK